MVVLHFLVIDYSPAKRERLQVKLGHLVGFERLQLAAKFLALPVCMSVLRYRESVRGYVISFAS